MLEMEIKARVENREALEHELKAHGLVFVRAVKETDAYYNAPDRDFSGTDEALRLRETFDCAQGARVLTLTYKGPKQGKELKTREEIETDISNGENMRAILQALGYKQSLIVEKDRIYYARGEVTACMDRVYGLGDFLELEMMGGEDEQTLFTLLEALGVQKNACTVKSYLEMLLELRQKHTSIK